MMVRTQIQLEGHQARRLKHLAAVQGRSMADLIREGVADLLARSGLPDPQALRRRALEAAGTFHSGRGDLSERHDDHLEDAFDA